MVLSYEGSDFFEDHRIIAGEIVDMLLNQKLLQQAKMTTNTYIGVDIVNTLPQSRLIRDEAVNIMFHIAISTMQQKGMQSTGYEEKLIDRLVNTVVGDIWFGIMIAR